MAIWFSLAALAKETAVLAPVALAGWEVLRLLMPKRGALRGLLKDADGAVMWVDKDNRKAIGGLNAEQ